ncbi:GIY-YIG nuclease family protein [Halotia branconii]|uniref:GIY-YIG nuclease family protein n=1 Tax=Halotia branconii CENA392 TaxID=1539056 RepID=A0AAJ6NYK6_9CYAN|nr:GIY-YIG nuclease family protein [Halotia branconii]WGV29128.1 GIY-YIG nuclease family protein [Halotia branconii CENA392]
MRTSENPSSIKVNNDTNKGQKYRYLIQVVYDGSESEFNFLSELASSCDAVQIERYIDHEYCDGRGDYRVFAYFWLGVKAEVFQQISSRMWGYRPTCMMTFDYDEDISPYEQQHVVYIIWAKGSNFYKIGHTSNINKRIKSVATGCPYDLEIKHLIPCVTTQALDIERTLHFRYANKRLKENTEWFILNDLDISEIIKN